MPSLNLKHTHVKGQRLTTLYLNFSQIHRGPKNGQNITRPLNAKYMRNIYSIYRYSLVTNCF